MAGRRQGDLARRQTMKKQRDVLRPRNDRPDAADFPRAVQVIALGPDAIKTSTTLNNLALLERSLGNTAEAEKLLAQEGGRED